MSEFLASAILDSMDRPAVAIISAVAMHSNADEFCRELALRGLGDRDVQAVAIVTPSQNAEIHFIGRYGPIELLDRVDELRDQLEDAIREKNRTSLRLIEIECSEGKSISVALLPSAPIALTSGVILIYFNTLKSEETIDVSTQVALAFACEMYCSPNWGQGNSTTGRNKRIYRDTSADARLTSRQKQVLILIAEGCTNERIARRLNYSVATVKNDISAVFQFLGVSNRHDAVVEAGIRGLIPPLPRISSLKD